MCFLVLLLIKVIVGSFYPIPSSLQTENTFFFDFIGLDGAPNSGHEAESTRVMIFSSFRESVQEIAEMLNRHQPLVRVMTFMGQASAGKGVRGFTQKEQLEVTP